eukprot:scaffold32657_cov31-Tisochrysis_lutea.AAC.4
MGEPGWVESVTDCRGKSTAGSRTSGRRSCAPVGMGRKQREEETHPPLPLSPPFPFPSTRRCRASPRVRLPSRALKGCLLSLF